MYLPPSTLLNRLLARAKFRHFQVLLKLAELGSIQRTAQSIHTTQSAVTQTLAYLERLLETPLFERHARGVRPTAACQPLLPVARRLLDDLLDGAESLSASLRGGSTLRLIASEAATNSVLLPVLSEFGRRHPTIQLQLTQAEGEYQMLAVARAEVDLLLCRQPKVNPTGWEFQSLNEDRHVVICAPDHALLRRTRLSWAALASQAWLPAPPGTAARERFDELVARFPKPPRIHPLVTRVLNGTVAVVRCGAALSLMPESIVRHLVDAGELAMLSLDEELPMHPIGLLRPAEGASAAATAFSSFLLRSKAAAPRPHRHAPSNTTT